MGGFAGKGSVLSYDARNVTNITAISKAVGAVVTVDDLIAYSDGDFIDIEGVGGMVEITDGRYKVSGQSGSTFVLQDASGTNVDSTGYTTFTSGGQVRSYGLAIDWAAIASLKDINISGMNRNTIDTTAMDSPGGYREFIGSLREAGEVTFSLNFTNAGYGAMKDLFESDLMIYFKVVVPDNAVEASKSGFKFLGLVTACPVAVPLDDVITADITIKIDGEITFDVQSAL